MQKDINVADQLAAIANTVWQVSCFGGNNLAKPKALGKIITAMIEDMLKRRSLVLEMRKLQGSAANDDQQLLFIETCKRIESAFPDLCGFAFEDFDKYFRFMGDEKNPGYLCINPTILPRIAAKVIPLFQDCKDLQDEPVYAKLQEMRTHTLSDFQRQISSMTYEWLKRVKSPAFFYANRIEEIKVGDLYSLKKISEPKSQHDRELLIKYFINDLVLGPFCFGNGNCQSMAELAFLLAIQNISSTPIRCVQFQDGAGKYEVLNAIIVGDWPKGNCTVLAPWYSKKPFEWKGSLAATPEIKHYSISKVLFTIKDSREQKMWQLFLQKANFDVNELLKSPNRVTYLKYIREQSQALYDLAQTLQQPEVEHTLNQ